MNVDFRYEDMTIVLLQKSLKRLGAIANIDRTSINFNINLNSADELNFTVVKNMDDNEEHLWDEIYSLRIIYCVELDKYYQISVTDIDSVNPTKSVVATALCESELSQIMLYNVEINTEIDIKRDGYVITKFYNPSDPSGSLLHRVLEKAPHYSIGYVDESLWNLQRQFSIDGTSIYDFLQGQCAEQFNCLFKYRIDTKTRKRIIDVYDLYTICMNDLCSYKVENKKRYRGDLSNFLFGEKLRCPHCNSTNLKYYGENTEIFVDVENLTNEVQLETLTDQIKNSFKLVGGDDNMTAAIINQNPNGTDYLYYFSDELKHDMSDELAQALADYDANFQYYTEEYEMPLDEVEANEYNDIINEYSYNYNVQTEEELILLDNPIVGYKNLIKYIYNNIDLSEFLSHTMMPVAETSIINSTTEKMAIESAYRNGKITQCPIEKVDANTSVSVVSSALKNMVKLYIKSGYVKIDVETTSWQFMGLDDQFSSNTKTYYYGIWSGHFKITNYSDTSDIQTTYDMSIRINMNYDWYMQNDVAVKLLDKLKDNTDYFNAVNYDITYGDNYTNKNEYSQYVSYYVGDWCIYNNKYYQCLVDIDSGEIWTPSHWVQIVAYDSNKTYEIGDYIYDYFTIGGKRVLNLWRRINNRGTGTPVSNPNYWEYGNINNRKLEAFKTNVLGNYNQTRLLAFRDATQGCLDILSQAEIGQKSHENYQWLYYPYYVKLSAIDNTINKISHQLNVVSGTYNNASDLVDDGIYQQLEAYRSVIQKTLNLKDYLIENELYDEFCSFRREDKYENSNYISVGLNTTQLFARANEFLEKANEEVIKAGTPQHQISSTLDNLFSIDEFKPLQDKCEVGNWIRIAVDEKVYRLRIISLGFNLNDFQTINVEFSDVTKASGIMSDIQSILNQSKSMASSYAYIQNQASASKVATETVNSFREDGLNFSNYNLHSSDKREVTLDQNGILLRSYDENTSDYAPEQVRLVNNSIVFTDDNWSNVKAALGKSTYHYYGVDALGIADCEQQLQAMREAGVEPTAPEYIEIEQKIAELSKETMRQGVGFGLNSDFVESGNIYGSTIIGGEIYSTNYKDEEGETPTGSYINMNDGTFSYAGGNLSFDGINLKMIGDVSQTAGHLTVFDEETNVLFNADITNHLVKTGGFDVKTNAIYKGTSSLTNTANGVYLGNDGIRNYKSGKYVNIAEGIIETKNIIDVDAKIVELDENKVDKVSGKQLSTNDYTTAEKNKLNGIEAGAEVNVIENVKVNGTSQQVTNKSVDLSIPSALSDLTDDSTHRVVTDTEKTTWDGKSVVTANPQTTSSAPNLNSIGINGTNYNIQGGGGGEGHDYDVSMNADLDEMTLSEDNVGKTTLPLVTEYIGTRANWNLLSPTEQAKYRRVTFLGEGGNNNYQSSHIGMVIHSTTLNSELLVQEIYGADTHWIQHTGYFLRGATSGVVANQLQEDGGEDTHTLTINEMPSHSHTTGISGSVAGALNSGTSCANVLFDQTTGKNTTSTGGGQAHNNVPKYKNVYIWERVS